MQSPNANPSLLGTRFSNTCDTNAVFPLSISCKYFQNWSKSRINILPPFTWGTPGSADINSGQNPGWCMKQHISSGLLLPTQVLSLSDILLLRTCLAPYQPAWILLRGGQQVAETVVADTPAQRGVDQYGWLWWCGFLVEPSFTGLGGPQWWCSLKTFRFTHMSLLVHRWRSQGITIWGVIGYRALDIIYELLT